jgi:hypothetical protein
VEEGKSTFGGYSDLDTVQVKEQGVIHMSLNVTGKLGVTYLCKKWYHAAGCGVM